jgi:hypothetical protein
MKCSFPLVFLLFVASGSAYLRLDVGDLSYDANNRTTCYYVFHSDHEGCAKVVEQAFRDQNANLLDTNTHAAAIGSLQQDLLGGEHPDSECRVAVVKRGVKRMYVADVFSNFKLGMTQPFEQQRHQLIDLIARMLQVELGFIVHPNAEPVNIYWVHYATGEEVPNHQVRHHTKKDSWIHSRLGHKFRIRRAADGSLKSEFMVMFDTFITFGSPTDFLTPFSTEQARYTFPTSFPQIYDIILVCFC